MDIENLNAEEQIIKEVSHPLYSSKGWIKLLGILLLIYGIMVALTLVGIIIAWLPIWLGVLLIQTSNKIADAQLAGDKLAMIKAQSSLGTYFTVYGVLTLIGMVIGVLVFIVALSTGFLAQMQEFAPDYY